MNHFRLFVFVMILCLLLSSNVLADNSVQTEPEQIISASMDDSTGIYTEFSLSDSETGTAVKVILETCYLTDEEITEAAKIASRAKPDFIKTSTGFGTGGATAAHVAIMKQNGGTDVQVKASGGIRSWEEAKAMLEAGATRLGVSAGMKIIAEM